MVQHSPMEKNTCGENSSSAMLVFPSARVGAFTRVYNQISPLLSDDNENIDSVKELYKKLHSKRKVFMELCEEELEGNASEEEKNRFADSYHSKLKEMTEHSDEVKHWLATKSNVNESEENSVISASSRSSAVSSARIRMIENRAKLDAEKMAYKKKLQLQRQMKELELNQREHEQDILERELEAINYAGSNKSIKLRSDNLTKKDLNKVFSFGNYKPKAKADNIESHTIDNSTLLAQVLTKQNEISMSLIQNQKEKYLPQMEIDVFDGKDVTEFKTFMKAFEKMVSEKTDDDVHKYYLLEKFTRGHPKQIVKSCNTDNATNAYQEAIQALRKKYGNEQLIAMNILKKLEDWPMVEDEDAKAYEELSFYLETCHNFFENTSTLYSLNSPKEIMKVVMKLPIETRKAWRSKANYIIESGEEVKFRNLVKFVSTQSSLLNQPFFGTIREARDKQQKSNSENSKRVLATEIKEKDSSATCPCCKKSTHALNECFFFLKKSYDDKVSFIRSLNLCFGCLCNGHLSRFCKNRLICNICNKNHPSCLHAEEKKYLLNANNSSQLPEIDKTETPLNQTQGNVAAAVFATQCHQKQKRILCASIPVKIRLEGRKGWTETYIGLDGHATHCFIDPDLMSEIGADGERTQVQLTTMNNLNKNESAKKVKNIEIRSMNSDESITLTEAFALECWPFNKEDSPVYKDVEHYDHLREIPFNFLERKIGILVGMNVPQAIKTLETVSGGDSEPYATRHKLGWALNGPSEIELGRSSVSCFRSLIVDLNDIEKKIEKLEKKEFEDENPGELGHSYEDQQWLQKVSTSINKCSDGKFEVDLPFRNDSPNFPNNYKQASSFLRGMKRKFINNNQLYIDYQEFMNQMIQNEYLQKIPEEELHHEEGKCWYLVHHAVYHKQKQKIRVVFNCSLKNGGTSLNENLLQGPDLTSSLIGVLLRFQEERFAFIADIEQMFFRVKVTKKHTDYLRVLWFCDGDFNNELVQYRMTVHAFGAVSSPSIANYALQHAVKDLHTTEVRDAIHKNFYVDDFMKSMPSEKQISKIFHEVSGTIAECGFNLKGVASNSRVLLDSLPKEQLSTQIQSINIEKDVLPSDRALGVVWDIEEDALVCKIQEQRGKFTRKSMLSSIASVFDPLGHLGPVIVTARAIFQQTCKLKLGWDEELPEEILKKWKNWINSLPSIINFKIPRCIRGPLTPNASAQLHVFCDGSLIAYAAAAYARFESESGEVYCCLIMTKSQQTPINNRTLKTVPRIELNAAKLAVLLQQKILREMSIAFTETQFWSDSTTVLKYIKNDTVRFQRFVANRVSFIRSLTKKDDWHHIPGKMNVSDMLSRGEEAEKFLQRPEWIKGPAFLWELKDQWPDQNIDEKVADEDEEVKKITVSATRIQSDPPFCKILKSSSDWEKIKMRIATFIRLKDGLKENKWQNEIFLPVELKKAETAIWKFIQKKFFYEEIKLLESQQIVKKSSPLRKLNPFVDEDFLLRVGGRIARCDEDECKKFPVILPSSDPVVQVLVRHHHRKIGHMGKHFLLSLLRDHYWIIGENAIVKSITSSCMICRKQNGRLCNQIMANLPKERLAFNRPPFFNTGIDFFGPFFVARGRAKEKRYGIVFSCMTSRALHLEVGYSLEASSFINALRRFFG